jgi:LPXTG-motif cell wall-anchored protein
MAKQATPPRITRDDLERNFRAIQENAKAKVDDQKSTVATIAGIGGVLLVLLVFLLGRRSGKKKTTIVEIRRV